MKALKFFNEKLYVSRSGGVLGVRQVGEYMYQIIDYKNHRLLCNGQLISLDTINECFSEDKEVFFRLDKLFEFILQINID